MFSLDTVSLSGAYGDQYTYTRFPFGTRFDPGQPGLYVITAQRNGLETVLYIGEADDLHTRCVPAHEKMSIAQILGATHILARLNFQDRYFRLAEETSLRHFYDPVLNRQ